MPLRVALGMINHLPVVIRLKAFIRPMFVGADRRTFQDILAHVSLKLRFFGSAKCLENNARRFVLLSALQDALHGRHMPAASVALDSLFSLVPMHVSRSCSDVAFVRFTDAAH